MKHLSRCFNGVILGVLLLTGSYIVYKSCQSRWGGELILPFGFLGLLMICLSIGSVIFYCGYSDKKHNRKSSKFVQNMESRIKFGLPIIGVILFIILFFKFFQKMVPRVGF